MRSFAKKEASCIPAGAGDYYRRPLISAFYSWAQTEVDNFEQVRSILVDFVLNAELQESDFEVYRESKLAESSITLETSSEWNNAIVAQIVSGNSDMSFIDNYFENVSKVIEGITFKDILEMRAKLIREDRMAFSIVTGK